MRRRKSTYKKIDSFGRVSQDSNEPQMVVRSSMKCLRKNSKFDKKNAQI